jgi:hypothetical protein
MKKVHERRFENLIKATLEAPKELFNMGMFAQSCGAPACLLGNYGDRTDLQRTFILARSPRNEHLYLKLRSRTALIVFENGKEVSEHFGITEDEASALFCPDGCNNAHTNRAKAIKYVRAFIKRKKAEQQ